jgi:hypothetical protein
MTFRLLDYYGNTFQNIEEIFTFKPMIFYIDETFKINIVPLGVEKCESKHFSSEQKKLFNETNFYFDSNSLCLNFNETDHFMNEYASKNSSFIHIQVNKCNEVDDNKKCDHSIMSDNSQFLYLQIQFLDSFIDMNKKDPKTYFTNMITQKLSLTMFKRNWLTFQNYELNLDSGIIFEDTEKTFGFSYTDNLIDIDNINKQFPNLVYELSLVSTKFVDFHFRKFLKIQDVLAVVGGIIKVLQMVGMYICNSVLKVQFKLDLINKLFDIPNDRITRPIPIPRISTSTNNELTRNNNFMKHVDSPTRNVSQSLNESVTLNMPHKKFISIKNYIIARFKKNDYLTLYNKIFSIIHNKLEISNLVKTEADIEVIKYMLRNDNNSNLIGEKIPISLIEQHIRDTRRGEINEIYKNFIK